jgi:hypothetical protein
MTKPEAGEIAGVVLSVLTRIVVLEGRVTGVVLTVVIVIRAGTVVGRCVLVVVVVVVKVDAHDSLSPRSFS